VLLTWRRCTPSSRRRAGSSSSRSDAGGL
jgi:hypothetical protein